MNNEEKLNEENLEEDLVTFEVKIAIAITNEDIDDIMCAALEGGITDWCGRAEVVGEYLADYASDQISRGGSLALYDIETGEEFILTKEKFINGFKKFIEDGRSDLINDGALAVWNIDSSDADTIVQYALFDKAVYG